MENFQEDKKTTNAKTFGNFELNRPINGVANNEVQENLTIEEVKSFVLESDDGKPFPDAVSLTKDEFITVGFGDDVIFDGEGADIELPSFSSELSNVKIEGDVRAVFKDGTVLRQTLTINPTQTGRKGVSTLFDIEDFKDTGFIIHPDPLNTSEEGQKIEFITADSIKIIGQDDEGDSPGFEVYQVNVLNAVSNDIAENKIRELVRDKDDLTGAENDSLVSTVYNSAIEGIIDFLDYLSEQFQNQGDEIFITGRDITGFISDFKPIADAGIEQNLLKLNKFNLSNIALGDIADGFITGDFPGYLGLDGLDGLGIKPLFEQINNAFVPTIELIESDFN